MTDFSSLFHDKLNICLEGLLDKLHIRYPSSRILFILIINEREEEKKRRWKLKIYKKMIGSFVFVYVLYSSRSIGCLLYESRRKKITTKQTFYLCNKFGICLH
jgi:hypothetical protein